MMQPHRLRHRVTFQQLTDPQKDDDGYAIPGTGGWQTVVLPQGPAVKYVDQNGVPYADAAGTIYIAKEGYRAVPLENVPAEVLTGPGREYQGGGTTQADTTARINLRWFPVYDLEMAKWRILWDGRIYNIQSVETDATARREWRLRCVNGTSEGQ